MVGSSYANVRGFRSSFDGNNEIVIEVVSNFCPDETIKQSRVFLAFEQFSLERDFTLS